MRRRWGSRLSTIGVVVALVATACSSDDGEADPSVGVEVATGGTADQSDSTESRPTDDSAATQTPAGPPPPPVTEVTARAKGPDIVLAWAPVEGADAYRVGTDSMAVDVPRAVCAAQCRVSIGAGRVMAGTPVTLRSVAEGGGVSEPISATVSGTPKTTAAKPTPPNELVLVSQGSPPTIKRVPFGSAKEAEQLLEKAKKNPALADAGMSLPARQLHQPAHDNVIAGQTQPEPAGEGDSSAATVGPATVVVNAAEGGVNGAWQEEFLQFDRLPGEPRGHDVVVAVVDGGVDAGHPALAGAVLDGTHMINDGDSGTSAPNSHGTAVAALIAGQAGGAVPGIAPGAKILPVDVMEGDETDGATVADGILWAVEHDADIVNVSMSSTCGSLGPVKFCPEEFDAAIEYAESQGVFVVAGAGNNGDGSERCNDPANEKVWPAVVGPVISVGGHGPVGQQWDCSPDRTDVDVLLPSTQLLVAQKDGGYEIGEGTSYAAPLMSGLLAVVLAERPDLTPAQVRSMLPQWQSANHTINVTAVLCVLEFIDCDGEQIEVPDVQWYYPYRATFSFSGDHPVNQAMPLVETTDGITSPEAWNPTAIQQGSAEFGEVTGGIFGMKDGTVQATGVMTYGTATSWFSSGEGYDLGPLHGYHVICPWSLPSGPQPVTVFGWQAPAVVEAELVSEAGDPEPQVQLSFSLGVGASATKAGELPPISYAYDTVDRCGAALAYHQDEVAGDPFDNMAFTSLDQVLGRHDEYVQTMESITQDFLASGPMTMTEPITIGSDAPPGMTVGSGVEQDPRVGIRIEHTPGGAQSEDVGWQ